MSRRGRHPIKAIDAADPIARARGHVQYYERGPGMICDFTITTREIFAPVKVKRVPHFRCTIRWLEHSAADEIAELSFHPSSREISCELWICSTDYAYRFFRVCDTGLVELRRDGTLLPAGLPVRAPEPGPAVPASGVPASGAPGPDSPTPVEIPLSAPDLPEQVHPKPGPRTRKPLRRRKG